jgi:hypothetical protein
MRLWSENMKERDHLEDLVVDGSVTVKRKEGDRTGSCGSGYGQMAGTGKHGSESSGRVKYR